MSISQEIWLSPLLSNNMNINQKEISANGIKLFIENEGREVAHAYLYILKNDIHNQPFGFMEDVFVDEECRGQGLGTEIINELIKVAREKNCYKVVGTSRSERVKVHSLYEKLGFKNHGFEFRIDL